MHSETSRCKTAVQILCKFLYTMATIKIIQDVRRANSKGEFPIKINICQGTTTVNISCNTSVPKGYFRDGKILKGYNRYAILNKQLEDVYYEYQLRLNELERTGKLRAMDAKAIKEHLINHKEDVSSILLTDYIDTYISRCKAEKTKATYVYAKSKICLYSQRNSLLFEDINISFLRDFEKWLIENSISINSRSIIFRCLRAVFNSAIDEDVAGQELYPFRKFKFRSEAKIKEYLTRDQVCQIRDTDFGHLNNVRDFFMLSFYLIGINPIDLFYLNEARDGRVKFKRKKTGKNYDVLLTPEALDIINRYKGTKHLLKFVEEYANYDSFYHFQRKRISQIGKIIGIDDITFYWARYSWATIAAELDIPKETIAQGLGHGGNSITDIYISFNAAKVDKANRMVLDYLMNF